MNHIDHINILTKRYHPWEVVELQNLIADGLRSLKCNSIIDEIPKPCNECKDCEYKHLCKTLGRVYDQINNIKESRKSRSLIWHRENFSQKFTKKY